MTVKLYHGDSLTVLRTLPPSSVHCVITSPPYHNLRDYGVEGQIGLEPTFTDWLNVMVELFREVRRVLHPSGTLWVNMGDSYNGTASRGTYGDQAAKGYTAHGMKRSKCLPGLHSKNLIGQPWRLAFALQDDGWILRSDIVWVKPNPMPESVEDRPIKAHEFVHLFAMRDRYYYDAEAVREPHTAPPERVRRNVSQNYLRVDQSTEYLHVGKAYKSGGIDATLNKTGFREYNPAGRTRRDVWSICTESFPGAHFATFPKKLVEPCLLAGTSERGCCPDCLAPWVRTFESIPIKYDNGNRKRADAPGAEVSESSVFRTGEFKMKRPTGWQQGCKCEPKEPIPCTVLDPFSGAGTTGVVARRWNRNYIGIELNKEYLEMSRARIVDDAPLFNQVEVIKI